jgi:hypothetical protein
MFYNTAFRRHATIYCDTTPTKAGIVEPEITRVEAGSNTSTVTLRVLGGDEKGSLKSERVK